MSRWSRFLGIGALVTLFFGVLSWFLVEHDDYYVTTAHLVLGLLLALVFVSYGGMRSVFSVAGKRVIGFSSGVFVYTLLFVLLIGLINLIAYRYTLFHYDSTEQKVFTLAPQTEKVLKALEEPLTIRAFFLDGVFRTSKEEDLIRRIVHVSPKITWMMIDPEKEPALIAKYNVLQDATLHLSYGAGERTRTAMVVANITEQNIVNAIINLTAKTQKVIYYLKGYGSPQLNDDRRQGYLLLKEALEGESHKVLELESLTSIPKDADLVILAAPQKLFLEQEIQYFYEYINAGGRAVLLHEPRTSDSIRLVAERFGVTIGEDVVLDPSRNSVAGASVMQPVISNYARHPITSALKGQTLFSIASSVTRGKELGHDSDFVELASSNQGSWAESQVDLVFSDNPTAGFDQKTDKLGPVSVAGALSLSASGSNKARLVIFGDADFVTNQFFRQVYNRDLFLNSVSWALGQDEQISIRSRAFRETTQRITNNQANVMFLFTGILMPEILLLIGFAVWWARRT